MPDQPDPPGGRRSTPATSSEQRGAVITALVANIVVALAKLATFLITGSSAVLAESLHSLADSTNEVLLLVGARRSSRPADNRHPFGHARFRYLYAFIVSLAVFWVGGVLAVFEGISHLASRGPILDPRWAFGVLGLGAILDGWSLRTTIRAGRSAKGALSWKQLVRATKTPELIVVLLEDLGALIGIGIALVGVALTTMTGDGIWDAVASIAIGALLMAIGLVVNRETQSLLLGESATEAVIASIRSAIETTPGIEGLVDLRTIHLGPDDLVIAVGIVVDPAADATAITRSIDEAKRRTRNAVPFRTVIYVEPRLAIPDPSPTARPPRGAGPGA
ncbi:MAG TPA: cation diffusion facilitator family transporter [Candidatus Limnocylindrales bacterium]|jgi:cation diffusion facilitator family transporter|nr:cation diffusion facilitator family transporter [Candidatus Limnocylindrales bacterium]